MAAADSIFTSAPSWFLNWLTIGIARAKWISGINAQLNHKTGAPFAWFFYAFAAYGLATRLTAANASLGSNHKTSKWACFWLAGWPFIGAARRLKKGAEAYASSLNVRAQAGTPAV
ncbi:hypothetical protein ASE01_18960 [Nocardioides sp. Root190]|uniref:hypothetical protein n=1 Tax=Nocardioides sp. Root190 TaxID=1736488 RepID=UPI0006FB2A36|nr:hypothetical protein [Nocardioides sp. Root190]KRB74073.1 hypothetical protein ASE01_18960 [Nocardioides sp. Root190]